MSDPVLLDVADGVAWITLNRPEAMNALNEAVRAALPAAVRAAEADEAVRAIVLRGAGERAFCSGNDISEFDTIRADPAAAAAYNALQREALAIKVERLGPRGCLGLVTIGGELNPISARALIPAPPMPTKCTGRLSAGVNRSMMDLLM